MKQALKDDNVKAMLKFEFTGNTRDKDAMTIWKKRKIESLNPKTFVQNCISIDLSVGLLSQLHKQTKLFFFIPKKEDITRSYNNKVRLSAQ